MLELINNIWAVLVDASFWLLLGLFVAGLVKTTIPESAMRRWLGGSGLSAVSRAALFGAPLPLCSCGVLPAALGVHRSGASKEATVSFLISTPETSIGSMAVTYALMGPLMALYRPVAAVFSAIITGMMTTLLKDPPVETESSPEIASCCGSSCSSESKPKEEPMVQGHLMTALRYGTAELLDDISKWLIFGIVAAGVMNTIIPPGWMAQWGGGIVAMLVMLLVGVPMYICASASTPVAAGLLIAGVSPGVVLVFLLVGPATNIAAIMLLRKELGQAVTLVYLFGISVCSIAAGLLLDWFIVQYDYDIIISMGKTEQLLPESVQLASAILLLVLIWPKLRSLVFPFLK